MVCYEEEICKIYRFIVENTHPFPFICIFSQRKEMQICPVAIVFTYIMKYISKLLISNMI
jgi:hypothetical protein